MQILHLISGLKSGGAENVLYKLIKHDKINSHHVITFSGGFYLSELKKNNIKVTLIEFNKYFFFLKLPRLINIIKKSNPDLIQSWMYHADFITIFLKIFFKKKNFYWNLRNTSPNKKWSSYSTIIISKICAFFSRIIPTKIIACSTAVAKQHFKIGYSKKKIKIIFNGFDPTQFKKNLRMRKIVRSNLKISNNNFLIGCFARFHPQKDHKSLLIAFNLLFNKYQNIRLLLIGDKIRKITAEPEYHINKKKIIISKPTSKINDMYNAIDLFVLPSIGYEGFPNVLAEAMLCEKYCLSTDVGDSRKILNKYGKIFKKNKPEDLKKKINDFYIRKKFFNKSGRKFILKNFNINQMIKKYNLIWNS